MNDADKELSQEISCAISDIVISKIQMFDLNEHPNAGSIMMLALSAATLAFNRTCIPIDQQHLLFDWFKTNEKDFYEKCEKEVKK